MGTLRRRCRQRVFDPRKIPGMILWLEPSVVAGLHGDAVSLWFDRSGSNNHANNATGGAQPFAQVGEAWSRGRGLGVLFDGTNDYLGLTNDTTGMPTSFFAVVRRDDVVNTAKGILVTHVHGWYSVVDPAGLPQIWGLYEDRSMGSTQTIPATRTIIACVARAFNDVDLLTNGGSKVNATNIVSGQARGGTRVAADPSGVQFYSGLICELIWFNRAVSVSERRCIEEYLYRRYVEPPSFNLSASPE